VTCAGEFVAGASAEQIRLAQQKKDGYAIDLTRLDKEVRELADRLLEQFPECTRYTKQQANFWKELAWHQTVGHAADWLALHFATVEPWEGMRAFVEKRPARYRKLRERAALGGSGEFVWGAHTKGCRVCGAQGLPEDFVHCGVCGATLTPRESVADRLSIPVESVP
jgi:hypothetical protein